MGYPSGTAADPDRRTTGDLVAVKPPEFNDPLSAPIYTWLLTLARLVKGLRVYAENNEMLQRFLEDVHLGIAHLLEVVPELSLTVREDRILYGKDAVHTNADREEGLPFLLYRNAFRRLTFVRGIKKEEILDLARALGSQQVGIDSAGADDLVSVLWRLALPHLRYLTIDALTVQAKTAKSGSDAEDIERVQNEIEGIVAAIYRTDASDEDIVRGLSITKEDLEALRELRAGEEEDLDSLDQSTSRAIADIPPEDLERFRGELELDTRDNLTRRLIIVLLDILFLGKSSQEALPVIGLLVQLFDSLLLSRRYHMATELLESLKASGEDTTDMMRLHVGRQILKLFATEARMMPVLMEFNDAHRTASIGDVLRLVRSVGPNITPILLSSLSSVSSPAHRRLLCDLIIDFGVPSPEELMKQAADGKWFVVRDVLSLAQHHPLESIEQIVSLALCHEHPKVREQAVGLLRGYGPGVADEMVARALADRDSDVRLAAIKVAALRKSPELKRVIESLLMSEDLEERPVRELRLLTAAHAAISGEDAVPVLDRILNPGFFAGLKGSDAQIAAAFALASVGSESARMSIQKGMRSLNAKVREACRRALSREHPTEDLFAATTAGAEAPELPASLQTAPTDAAGMTAAVARPAVSRQVPSIIAEGSADGSMRRSVAGDEGWSSASPSRSARPTANEMANEMATEMANEMANGAAEGTARRATDRIEKITLIGPQRRESPEAWPVEHGAPRALARSPERDLADDTSSRVATVVAPLAVPSSSGTSGAARGTRDVVMGNLPPAPGTRDLVPGTLPPATTAAITRDVVMGNLPPAPGTRDIVPGTLPPAQSQGSSPLSAAVDRPVEADASAKDMELLLRAYLGEGSQSAQPDGSNETRGAPAGVSEAPTTVGPRPRSAGSPKRG